MLKSVGRTAQYTSQKIDEILSQMIETHKHVQKKLKWYSLERNQALFSQPYIKQKLVGEITGATSRTTLTKYMHELVELGVLSANEEGREVFYVNDDCSSI